LPTQQQQQAATAIRHIGTNALPLLVKWLEYKRPGWQVKLDATLYRFDDWRLIKSIRKGISRDKEIELHSCAILGFAMLRAESNRTVQDVLRLTDDPERSRAYRALSALSLLGKEGLVALTGIAGDPTSANQYLALKVFAALRPLGTNVSPAIPTIVRAASDADPDIAQAALYSLCILGLEPGMSFPVFTNAIASTNRNLKVHTIHHVGYFGTPTDLQPLVPSISNCLHDADIGVRSKAIEMLTHIAPEITLRSAEVDIRRQATHWIELVGTSWPPAEIAPYLQACLADTNEEVRRATTNALRQIAPEVLTNTPPR